jgi:hypothetical protein
VPSSKTITASDHKLFTANTSIKSAEMNTNFDRDRGHILPMETDTIAASDLSHDLGASDHRFVNTWGSPVVNQTLSASPVSGELGINTSTNKVQHYDGSNWKDLGGGAAGAVLFDDFDADAVSSIVEYDDVSAAVDLTGGSPNVTSSAETTNPLYKTNSYKLSKDAVDRVDEGWAIAMDRLPRICTVGPAAVTVSFWYETSANYVSGDVVMHKYADNSGLESLNAFNGSNSLPAAPDGALYTAQFYLNSSDTLARIGWHIDTTNANAYDIIVDVIDISVSPKINAAIMEAWTDFTPTFNNLGGWTSAINKTFRWRRVNENLEIVGSFQLTGSGSGTSQIGLDITSAISGINAKESANYNYGTVETRLAGTYRVAGAGTNSTTEIGILKQGGTTWIIPNDITSGDLFFYNLSIPIAEWDNGAVMSTAMADVRTFKARMSRITSAFNISTANETAIVYNKADIDTHNATNISTGEITVPATGYYRVMTLNRLTNTTASESYTFRVRINGTNYAASNSVMSATSNFTAPPVFDLIYLQAGDVVSVSVDSTSDTNYDINYGSAGAGGPSSFLIVEAAPDFSVFGVQGVFETKSATSSVKTPSATNHYHQLTGNGLTLGPGTWELMPVKALFSYSGSPTYSSAVIGWYGGNGTDTSSAPTALSSVSGVTVLTGSGNARTFITPLTASTQTFEISSGSIIIKTTEEITVYAVTYAQMTTASAARITVYPQAKRLQ